MARISRREHGDHRDDGEARRRAALRVRRNMIIMNLIATALVILVTIIVVVVANQGQKGAESQPKPPVWALGGEGR